MIPILVVTHGGFADGIIDSTRLLVGKSEELECISIGVDDNFDLFQKQIQTRAMQIDRGEGVLVLVDLLGGSPYNAVAKTMAQTNVECITGLNLGMLLTALEQREHYSLKELAQVCKAMALSSIVNARERLFEKDNEDDAE